MSPAWALGNASSKRYSFQTAAAAAGAGAPFRAILVGDMGVNNSARTRARMEEMVGTFNATIHVGDVSYADDTHVLVEPSSGSSYEAAYDLFQV